MYWINNDAVYVKVAQKGAIYDFESSNVYWISAESCDLLDKLAENAIDYSSLSKEEQAYISLLRSKNLYSEGYKIKEYMPMPDNSPKIEMAWLEITQACNCKCLHCYQGDEHGSVNNVLKIDEWRKIIEELASLGISRVVVIGGEPCAHKNICEILSELYQKGIDTTLFTNATIMNPELMDLLIRCSDKISVKVSLYGDNASVHDYITQCPGSFDRLVGNVRRLTSNGVTVNIAVVAMRENQDELSNIKEFVLSLGAKYAKFDVIRNVFGGTQDQHTPTNSEIINSCLFCRPHFRANRERFEGNCKKNSCWYGKIAITETGDILPCVFERNLVYGNTRQSSIRNVLHSQQLLNCWYMDFSHIDFCKDCEFRYSCKDCRPLGISVDGKITTKNPRCKYNPYSGEWK